MGVLYQEVVFYTMHKFSDFFFLEGFDGVIPFGVKVASRGLGSKICRGCNVTVETLCHLFVSCLCLSNAASPLAVWINKVQKVKFSRL